MLLRYGDGRMEDMDTDICMNVCMQVCRVPHYNRHSTLLSHTGNQSVNILNPELAIMNSPSKAALPLWRKFALNRWLQTDYSFYFLEFFIFEFLKLFTNSYFRVVTSCLLSSFRSIASVCRQFFPLLQLRLRKDVLSSCFCLFCHCIDGGLNECCAHASARNLLHRNRDIL